MDEATFRDVHATVNTNFPSWEELYEAKAEKYRALEKKLEAYQLVGSYVQDLIDMWPTVSIRTIYKVTQKVADLKEALTLVK